MTQYARSLQRHHSEGGTPNYEYRFARPVLDDIDENELPPPPPPPPTREHTIIAPDGEEYYISASQQTEHDYPDEPGAKTASMDDGDDGDDEPGGSQCTVATVPDDPDLSLILPLNHYFSYHEPSSPPRV